MFVAEPGVFAEPGTLETFAAEPGFLNTTVAFEHSSTPEMAFFSWLIDLDKALIKKIGAWSPRLHCWEPWALLTLARSLGGHLTSFWNLG